jgi:hypothetical protein
MKELEAVTNALTEEEKKLEQLPHVIKRIKENMKAPVCEAVRLHKLSSRSQDQPTMMRRNSMRLTRLACMRLTQSETSSVCCK